MRILTFMGSPRLGGNTDLLLESFIKGAKEAGAEVEKISLYRVKIGPCIECGECDTTGECVIADDMKEIYPKIDASDVIVVASPIFFYNISAYTQALVERSQARWVSKYVLKKAPPFGKEKRGIFLSLGATKGKKLFEGVQRVIKYFFDAVYTKYEGGLFYRGIEKKGAIQEHPTALIDAYELGKAVATSAPEKWPLVREPSP